MNAQRRWPGLLLGAALALTAPRAGAMVADRYAAQVNARVITVSDVLGALGPIRQRLADTYSGSELEKKLEDAFKQGLDQLVERALILEDFTRQDQKLPDQVVDGRVNEVIHDRFNNSRAAFFEALTEEHLTLNEWRDEAKNHLILSMLRHREVMDKVVVTPGDVRARYEANLKKYQLPEKIHLRAIVLHQLGGAEQKVQELRQRLTGGASFEALAREFSQGSGAKEGGDWGWLQPQEIRKELAAAIAGLQPGQLSPVALVDGEYYLLKLEAHQVAQVKPLDAVYNELENELKQQEAERIYKGWVERLKQRYYVKIFPLN